jgi:hypothetical protein
MLRKKQSSFQQCALSAHPAELFFGIQVCNRYQEVGSSAVTI